MQWELRSVNFVYKFRFLLTEKKEADGSAAFQI